MAMMYPSESPDFRYYSSEVCWLTLDSPLF